MRKPLLALLPLLLLLAAPVAVADGITITGTPVSFTDCASGGSTAQTIGVAGQQVLVTVTTETVWLCLAASSATCAAGGTQLPAGTVMVLTLKSDQVSAACRSTSAAGDLQTTKVN